MAKQGSQTGQHDPEDGRLAGQGDFSNPPCHPFRPQKVPDKSRAIAQQIGQNPPAHRCGWLRLSRFCPLCDRCLGDIPQARGARSRVVRLHGALGVVAGIRVVHEPLCQGSTPTWGGVCRPPRLFPHPQSADDATVSADAVAERLARLSLRSRSRTLAGNTRVRSSTFGRSYSPTARSSQDQLSPARRIQQEIDSRLRQQTRPNLQHGGAVEGASFHQRPYTSSD